MRCASRVATAKKPKPQIKALKRFTMDSETSPEKPQETTPPNPRQAIYNIIMHERCLMCVSTNVKTIVDLFVLFLTPA